jgi:type IV secretory pathway TrbL component
MRRKVVLIAFFFALLLPFDTFAGGAQTDPFLTQQQIQQQQQQAAAAQTQAQQPMFNRLLQNFITVLVGPSGTPANGIIGTIRDQWVPTFMRILFALEILFIGAMMLTGQVDSIGSLLTKLVVLGLLTALALNFTIISIRIKNGMIWIITQFVGPFTGANPNFTVQGLLNDPTMILTWAYNNLINVYHQGLDQMWGGSTFGAKIIAALKTPGYAIIFGIIDLLEQLAFVVLVVELVVAQIEFYIMLLFGLIFCPLVVFEPLRFMGTRSFMAVIGQTIKLGMTVAVICIGLNVMSGMSDQLLPLNLQGQAPGLDMSVFFGCLATTLCIVFLAWQVPALAMGFISGNPSLGAGGAIGFAVGMASTAVALGRGIGNLVNGNIAGAARQAGGAVNHSASAGRGSSGTTAVSSAPTSGAAGYFQPQSSGSGPESGGASPQGGSGVTVSPSGGGGGGGSKSGAVSPSVNPTSSGSSGTGSSSGPAGQLFQPGGSAPPAASAPASGGGPTPSGGRTL